LVRPDRGPAPLTSPARLAEFFAPRRIALVGASETSGWSRFVFAAAAAAGFSGELIPVHPVHRTVFGRPAVRRLADLAAPADLAFVMVPTHAVAEIIEESGEAGRRGAVVLASGYREAGDAGRAEQDLLAGRARELGITLLGPNCLGFVNVHDGAAPFALTLPSPLTPGPVGIALASGALAGVVLGFARSRAIGVSTLVTLGNEAMVTAADVIEYFVEDDRTRAICVFLEDVGDVARLSAAAERADLAGKPIVALKTGSSPAGQRAALAHTGSVTGNDAVANAALRQLNIIRVGSIEELLTTASVLAYGSRPQGRRMGVLTASGGACGLIADHAHAAGFEIPPFAPQTTAAIAAHLPEFATVGNPLDVTGYFLANRREDALTPIDHALDAAVADPGLDFVLFAGVTLPETRPADERLAAQLEDRFAWLGRRIATAPIPVVCLSPACVDVTNYARDVLTRHGIHPLGGIDLGVRAIDGALRWLERRGHVRTLGPRPHASVSGSAWSELDARMFLENFGIPTVPADLADSADAAAVAAQRFGFPVALKACSALIPHKSDIGAVALGLQSAAAVRAAYGQVRSAAEAATGTGIEGVLVSPLRGGGVELLAGVTIDPVFGPVLTVGLGGIWVEVLRDISLRLLPASSSDVAGMLAELRGHALLTGARGREPVDVDALAQVLCRLGEAALSLGDALDCVEINPLWVSGTRIEALDVLVVSEKGPAT